MNNKLGLYTEKKPAQKDVKPDVLSKLEHALTDELEQKANVIVDPRATEKPTQQQAREQKALVKEPNLFQRNKLGDYGFAADDQNSEASRAMMIQRLQDGSDLDRIRKQNDSLRHLSSQFGLSALSDRSHKKLTKKNFNKLASQTHL